MKTSFKRIDEIFNFKGSWGVHSKCGLKIVKKDDKYIVMVSELYQDNPGTSITQAACLLAEQICKTYNLPKKDLVYIEHNPAMNSKLSFYDEEFYQVKFDIVDDKFSNPQCEILSSEKIDFF